MTKVREEEMYCQKCNKKYRVPVILSTNSFMIEMDKNLKERYENGTLFKNICPVCGNELKKID